MAQKAICPRGHIWDPSMLGGLPPTEKPRCPICGEEEPLRLRNALARLIRWCRQNALLSGLLSLCLVLAIALVIMFLHSRARQQSLRGEVDQAQLKVQQAEEKNRARRRGLEEEEEANRQKQQAEFEATKWRQRHDDLQNQLQEAKQARLAAVRQRDEQAHARKLADELRQTADELRQEAQSRRAEAARQLMQMYVAAGTQRMEGGDLSTASLWFAEALRLAQKEKTPEETHRLRLATVLAQCPRPVQLWTLEGKISAAQFSADGKRLLTAGADGKVALWDTVKGQRIGEPLPHMAALTQAVLSADGKRALTATTDMTIHLWDLDMGK